MHHCHQANNSFWLGAGANGSPRPLGQVIECSNKWPCLYKRRWVGPSIKPASFKASRAITRKVVSFPPLTLMRPAPRHTRCSRRSWLGFLAFPELITGRTPACTELISEVLTVFLG